MRNIFEKLAKYALLRGILYIALGILMLIAPQVVMHVIVYILAAYAIIMGIINMVAYLRNRRDGVGGFGLVTGVLLIVLGIVMIIFTRGILSILPIFLGALLILAGVSRLIEAIGGGSGLGTPRLLLVIIAILVIIGGFLVILNPFSTSVLLFQIFGIIAIIQGVGEVISYFTFRKAGKDS